MRRNTQASGPVGSGPGAPPSPRVSVRYVDREQSQAGRPAHPLTTSISSSAVTWNVWSAWPGHPALLPPLPREARSSLPSDVIEASAPTVQRQPARAPRGASARPTTVMTTPARPTRPQHARTTDARGYTVSTPTFTPAAAPQRRPARHFSPGASGEARPVQPAARQRAHVRAQIAPRSGVAQFPANLEWPSRFDDWMIDIMRRRALRLNSGARRRGSPGSVRAVELAHIMENSTDDQGRWICAICHLPMTLQDLSFDHIVALADGGEHAAHNLAPTHRKCNEIKGSEKAQYRVQARDRWLSEWATGQTSIGSVMAGTASTFATQSAQSRYA